MKKALAPLSEAGPDFAALDRNLRRAVSEGKRRYARAAACVSIWAAILATAAAFFIEELC